MTTLDLSGTAHVLLDAWRSGALLTELPADLKPATLAEGYATQEVLLSLAGFTSGGWKLGVGSPGQLRAGKLERPLVGRVDRARFHSTGANIAMPSADPVTVECEIAFVLARDLAPQSGREIEPRDVRHACVTFELVRSRFVDRRAVGWPSFVADNVGFEALVIGEPFCEGLDLEAVKRVNDSVVVLLAGQDKARAQSGDAATDPMNSLAALYGHAAEHGITLREGDIVTTGAMCTPFDLAGTGHAVTARYAGGEVLFTL